MDLFFYVQAQKDSTCDTEGEEGAREAVAQWAILRSRKSPERVNRNEQRVEAKAMPAATIEVAYRFESYLSHIRQGDFFEIVGERKMTEGTGLRSNFA